MSHLLRLCKRYQFDLHLAYASDFAIPTEVIDLKAKVWTFPLPADDYLPWQKEHLFNLAFACSSTSVSPNDRCYFFDVDIFFNEEWFLTELASLAFLDNKTIIQGFSHLRNGEHSEPSWAFEYSQQRITFRNTGLIWGMTASLFKELGGFTYLPDGSGDSAWVSELLGECSGDLCRYEWFRLQLRSFPALSIRALPVTMTREKQEQSDYENRARIYSYFYHPLASNYILDDRGCVRWAADAIRCLKTLSHIDLQSSSWRNVFSQQCSLHLLCLPTDTPRLYLNDVIEGFFDFNGSTILEHQMSESQFSLLCWNPDPSRPLHSFSLHCPKITQRLLAIFSCLEFFSAQISRIGLYLYDPDDNTDHFSWYEMSSPLTIDLLKPTLLRTGMSLRLDFECIPSEFISLSLEWNAAERLEEI